MESPMKQISDSALWKEQPNKTQTSENNETKYLVLAIIRFIQEGAFEFVKTASGNHGETDAG